MAQTTSNTSNIIELPHEVSMALLDPQTLDLLERLLAQAGVTDPDVSSLGSETYFLATRQRTPSAYIEEIVKEYGIDEAAARSIARAVVSQVLAPHREALDPRVFAEFERQGDPSSTDETRQDDMEIETDLEHVKESRSSILEDKGPLDVAALVKEICANQAFQFNDAALRSRCEKLVESRVRDVRSAEQTRAQLERPVDKGGLGVSGRRLSDILQFVESRVAAFQGRLEVQQQRTRVEQTAVAQRGEELAKKEETLLTKRYVELTGKVPQEHVAPTSPGVTRASAGISAHHEQQAREGRIDAQKIKDAVRAQQVVPAPHRPVSAPSMQEVVFTKRLAGPVEELGSLSLTDFRRLSHDPHAAAMKVKDKVELLEEQAYDKKVAAIKAWRNSPLNLQYVALTRQAVQGGISVAELLSKKRTAGEETLNDEELKAVMALNAELRF